MNEPYPPASAGQDQHVAMNSGVLLEDDISTLPRHTSVVNVPDRSFINMAYGSAPAIMAIT